MTSQLTGSRKCCVTMFGVTGVRLLGQAREVAGEELETFCVRCRSLLSSPGPETLDILRRLHVIMAASPRRRLASPLVGQIMAAAVSGAQAQLQAVCAAILCQLCPMVTCDPGDTLAGHFLCVYLAQASRSDLRCLGPRLCRVLESRAADGHTLRAALPGLMRAVVACPEILNEDHVNVVNKKMADCLRYASVHHAGLGTSSGFFSSPRAVCELDGTVSTDFFTILNVSASFTDEQWLNVQSFSVLRRWLLLYGAPEAEDKSEVEGSVISMVSASSTSSRLVPPRERLREKSFEYCLRVVEQCNRAAVRRPDADLQRASIVEAVSVMDLLCKQDVSFVYRSLPVMKGLHGRLCLEASLAVAQFYVHHSEAAAVESEAVYRHLFIRVPAECYHKPLMAFQFLRFCRVNGAALAGSVEAFRTSYPNVIKLVAWNAAPLLAEFCAVLPLLINADSAIEILHSLLDLPCVTASMELQHDLPEALRPYKSAFQYLLRCEAWSGPAPEGLNQLRALLSDTCSTARVAQCAQVVPCLLQLYISSVTSFADGPLISRVMVTLIERSGLLYGPPAFQAEVQRVLSRQIPLLCRLHPAVVIELSRDLLDFLSSVSNIERREALGTHVIWAIGEVLSVAYDKRASVEQINRFFEVLEALLFEMTQLRGSSGAPTSSPRLITTLMTTLTKLASRSQDLIPRVSLYLSKMRSCVQSEAMIRAYGEEASEEILIRATELLNLLKLPSVAQYVLTPPPEMGERVLHCDPASSLPLAIRTSSYLLQRDRTA